MWSTTNINVATYIAEIKSIPNSGHFYKGSQLWLEFDITPEQGKTFTQEYINSKFAHYDARKRNFIDLLRTSTR